MLQVVNLSYAYNHKIVIADINCKIEQGELVCLLGANGSGKTTFLKCLNGILKKDKGNVYLNNKKLENLKCRQIARLITYIPQEHRTVFSYNVLDFVSMGITPYLRPGKVPNSEVAIKANEILKELNIGHLSDRNYDALSGGEKRLVLIARALMQNTDYLVFDEPTSHLDFKNKYLILKEIKKLTASGKGIIIALHDPNLALKFCDRIVIIKEGSIIASGKPQEVINSNNLELAYEVSIGIDQAGRIQVNM